MPCFVDEVLERDGNQLGFASPAMRADKEVRPPSTVILQKYGRKCAVNAKETWSTPEVRIDMTGCAGCGSQIQIHGILLLGLTNLFCFGSKLFFSDTALLLQIELSNEKEVVVTLTRNPLRIALNARA